MEKGGLGKGREDRSSVLGFGMGRVWGKWLGSGAGEVGLGSGLGEVGSGKWYWGSGIGEVGVWEVGFGKWAQQGAKFGSGRNRAQNLVQGGTGRKRAQDWAQKGAKTRWSVTDLNEYFEGPGPSKYSFKSVTFRAQISYARARKN